MRPTPKKHATASNFAAVLRIGALVCALIVFGSTAPMAYAQDSTAPASQAGEAAPQPRQQPETTQPPIMQQAAPMERSQPGQSNGTLPHNLSPWGMFMAADRVVK
ncbi:MAG TPA: hypothetical protein VK604_02140, partial [Bryobacteraceae bacterium]|nr:hypothetical protein [Bryobacteraceae bacterium]